MAALSEPMRHDESATKLLFLYFSGTGNTDYVAHYLAGRLAQEALEVELQSIEHRPAADLPSFDYLVLGFPVYACDSPDLVQDYVSELPPGEGRGAFVFRRNGAWRGRQLAMARRRPDDPVRDAGRRR